MIDYRKLIENKIWKYISAHRYLTLLAIVILSVGSLSGSITALKEPYRLVADIYTYWFDSRPDAGSVVLERNAFMAGMLFRELQLSSLTQTSIKPSIDSLGKSFTAVGFGDADIRTLISEKPKLIRSELFRIREKFEGHLETKGYRIKAFFDLGYHLRSLADATTGSNRRKHEAAHEINALVLHALDSAQKGFPVRLPQLPLIEIQPSSSVPDDYIVKVIESIKRLKILLSVGI